MVQLFAACKAECKGGGGDGQLADTMVLLPHELYGSLAQKNGFDARLIITIAAGVFILPFFLFSATAGQLADKYDKAFLIRRIKFVEIILMALAALGFYLQHAYIV